MLQLSLPVSAAVLENLVKRKVVSLSSCCNLTWLPGIDTFQPFNQLNLTNLRELKLIGKNCDWIISTLDIYPNLCQVYHNSVQPAPHQETVWNTGEVGDTDRLD